jgi:pyruvate/2-oxoglutarate dehydrogenase complex dihydrolipoamide dehydrogenase (E3) component
MLPGAWPMRAWRWWASSQLLGGECPYWGCVPSKMMTRAANRLAEARRIPGVAGDATVRPKWGPVAQRIRDEATDDWDDRVAVERFEGKGGRFVRGEGRILPPARVAVGDREIEVRRGIVVATGTHAAIPPLPGLGRVPYWTNREAIEAKELPSSLIVLGGGSVGVELAQVFARFGVEVTVVEALDRLVPAEEPEAEDVGCGRVRGPHLHVRPGRLPRQPAAVAVDETSRAPPGLAQCHANLPRKP